VYSLQFGMVKPAVFLKFAIASPIYLSQKNIYCNKISRNRKK